MKMNFKNKICIFCGDEFKPHAGPTTYCYKEECQRKGVKVQKDKGNIVRKTERQAVKRLWGICIEKRNSLSGTSAENAGVVYLEKDGYKVVNLTTYFTKFMWDLLAIKDRKRYLVQVTRRTHVDDVKKHLVVANLLGLEYMVLFVSPCLTKFIIKHPVNGYCELRLSDFKGGDE